MQQLKELHDTTPAQHDAGADADVAACTAARSHLREAADKTKHIPMICRHLWIPKIYRQTPTLHSSTKYIAVHSSTQASITRTQSMSTPYRALEISRILPASAGSLTNGMVMIVCSYYTLRIRGSILYLWRPCYGGTAEHCNYNQICCVKIGECMIFEAMVASGHTMVLGSIVGSDYSNQDL